MTWILLRDIEPHDIKQEDTIYDVGTFPHVLKGEWSDEQVKQVVQNIKKTDSRDTNVILEMVEEFLPTPIRDVI